MVPQDAQWRELKILSKGFGLLIGPDRFLTVTDVADWIPGGFFGHSDNGIPRGWQAANFTTFRTQANMYSNPATGSRCASR
jgi:hypothetical protein